MDYRIIGMLAIVLGVHNDPAVAFQEWIHLSSKNGDMPAPGPATEQTASLVLDVDRDGVEDFIIGSRLRGASVLWYRRSADGWSKYVVEAANLTIEAGGAFHDIDQDGDLDIVFGSDSRDNKIWWWENPWPIYDPSIPWPRREIKNAGSNKHHDMIFGDFDGDAQAEFVFWNQGENKLFIAEIPANPRNNQPWSYTAIFTSLSQSEGLAKADVDGDGQLDIVGGGRWFKHNGGTSYTPNIIDDEQRFTRAAAGDLKVGGWPEVVFVSGDGVGPLKWYEWTGSSWVGHDLLGFNVDHGHSLDIADVNRDGLLDIFCAEMRLNGDNPNAKTWLFLGDGNGSFTETVIATGFGNHESKLGDLDDDGDLDILGKTFNWDTPRVDVWLNHGTGQPLHRWQRHVIDPVRPWRAIFVTSGDIDGDSLNDIITGGWWYKNPGSPHSLWTRNTIGSPFNNVAAVYDFDGDGDVDVLGTQGRGSISNDSLVWARNDSLGVFTILNNITKGEGDFLQGVAVAQFQPGGPLEVALSWHKKNQGVQMLTVPPDPSNEVWPWRRISVTSQDEALSVGDIDRDGDLDLLLGTMWLRNDSLSWSAYILNNTSGNPDRNRLADVNGDGRLDAVVGFEAISKEGKVAWYEQDNLAASIWTEHVIATDVIGPMSLDVADMDGDGDVDVVVGEHNLANSSSARLYLFKNLDSRGASWTKHLAYTGDEHHDGAQVVDIDSDGDLDIISIGWSHSQVLLYENKASHDDIIPDTTAPAILVQPQSVTVNEGKTATFRMSAIGSLPLMYQWHKNGVDIPGAAGASYTTPPTTFADSGAAFACVVTNAYGSATSDEAVLNVVSVSNTRITDGQIALYTFDEGSGATVYDVSGAGAALNLIVDKVSAINWIPGGLAIKSATIIATTAAATKIIDSCRATNEISIEAWIKPANTKQSGPARIVSLSTDPFKRNFTLGQSGSTYETRLRTTKTSNNGFPALSTPEGSATTKLSHVVYTRDDAGTATLYIDGAKRASMAVSGSFSNWGDSFRLALGNEITNNRPWLGEFHLLAIYNRAITSEEVIQNYDAGPEPGNVPRLPKTPMNFSAGLPAQFELQQNFPNPFNPKTQIAFSLPRQGLVTLKIFTIRGEEVTLLLAEELSPGRHQIEWNAEGLPSGVYFYRLSVESDEKTELYTGTKKLLLLK
jgi:hypothetical protein